MSVHLHVEGAGNGEADRRFRDGLRALIDKVCPTTRQLHIIPGGSRHKTFERYCRAVENRDADVILLLVDSEEEVSPPHDPWKHLKQRRDDQWTRPPEADREFAHLMVQCMESWFLADREALASFYGQGFRPGALPAAADIESIPKSKIKDGLAAAVKATNKPKYEKTGHGFAILALISPDKVRRASRHAERFFAILESKLQVGG